MGGRGGPRIDSGALSEPGMLLGYELCTKIYRVRLWGEALMSRNEPSFEEEEEAKAVSLESMGADIVELLTTPKWAWRMTFFSQSLESRRNPLALVRTTMMMWTFSTI